MKHAPVDTFEVVRIDRDLVVVRHRRERHEFTFRRGADDDGDVRDLQLLSFFEAGRPLRCEAFVIEAQAFARREVRRRTLN